MYVILTALIIMWACLAYVVLYVYGRLGQIEGKLNWLFNEELQQYRSRVELTSPNVPEPKGDAIHDQPIRLPIRDQRRNDGTSA